VGSKSPRPEPDAEEHESSHGSGDRATLGYAAGDDGGVVAGDDGVASGAPPSSVRSGDELANKYKLIRQLDEGGMGSLWVAHNKALDINVAVKVIRPGLGHLDDDERQHIADRFLSEARACARLGHPAIVRALDFGTIASGDPFIVMELLDGEDLDDALSKRGTVAAKKAVRMLMPIAHALAAAHEQGIVHRDIKPSNVFLAQLPKGGVQPKLIDFGVAKFDLGGRKRITHVGSVVGSPGYMSPQQARGDDAGASADVWAFCVLLYEVIAGRLPFEARNPHKLLRAIIEDDPTPLAELDDQPGGEELRAIVMRGKVVDRWPSMRDLGAALAEWLLDQDVFEDVCGASLEATWLEVGSADAFASLPPPRRFDDAPDIDDSPSTSGRRRRVSSASRSGGRVVFDVESDESGESAAADASGSAPLATADEERQRRFMTVLVALCACGVLLGGFAVWRLTGERAADEVAAPDTGGAALTAHERATAASPAVAPSAAADGAASASAVPSSSAAVDGSASAPARASASAPPAPRRPKLRRPRY
jgi:serine/threonine-protein kinase